MAESVKIDQIVVTLRPGTEVGEVMHCWTALEKPYTLRVLSSKDTLPNDWHPRGTRWFTVERIHGAHVLRNDFPAASLRNTQRPDRRRMTQGS